MGETEHKRRWSVVIQQNQKFNPWMEEKGQNYRKEKKKNSTKRTSLGAEPRDAFSPCGYTDRDHLLNSIIHYYLLLFIYIIEFELKIKSFLSFDLQSRKVHKSLQ